MLSLLAGCQKGPIPTPGAESQPPELMARVRVTQHGGLHEWNGYAIHIDKFYVGGVAYAVTGDGAEQMPFLVTPGPHTFMVDYGRCVHSYAGTPSDDLFTGPFGRFEATVEGGAEYVLTADSALTGPYAVQTRHALKRVDGSGDGGGADLAPATGPATAPSSATAPPPATEPASRPAGPSL